MAKQTEEEHKWLVALSAGDFEAFNMLYEKHCQSLYSFTLKLSKNPHEAEELVQSVFVTVWEWRQTIDPGKSFSAYLFGIARNRFYDMLRKRVVESCYADYILQQNNLLAEDIEKQIEDRELTEIINQLLQQVPARRLEIFRMSRDKNLSYKQIAKKLQISENTVDTQIRNVLDYLRRELPKYLKMALLFC
jgi:RNA polymerase sigma-70 factor (ECF subfamily)